MFTLISPAKSLNTTPYVGYIKPSDPFFTPFTQSIISKMAKKKVSEIKNLMDISEKLAVLNYERYQAFDQQDYFTALTLFDGDVYDGLNARTLNDQGQKYAQDHVRILSGLYGLLRPYDQIRPYRLEMGLSLSIGKAENLYQFWGDRLANQLTQEAKNQHYDTLINLASQEYAKAALTKALKMRVITCKFLEIKEGHAKLISFYAKRARGEMARFIIDHEIKKPEQLKEFDRSNYCFDPKLSDEKTFVFSRPQPEIKKN